MRPYSFLTTPYSKSPSLPLGAGPKGTRNHFLIPQIDSHCWPKEGLPIGKLCLIRGARQSLGKALTGACRASTMLIIRESQNSGSGRSSLQPENRLLFTAFWVVKQKEECVGAWKWQMRGEKDVGEKLV